MGGPSQTQSSSAPASCLHRRATLTWPILDGAVKFENVFEDLFVDLT